MRIGTLLAASLLAVPAMALAAPIPVPNHSFEAPIVADGSQTYGDPTDWVFAGSAPGAVNANVKNPTTDKTNQDGSQFLANYLDNNDSNPATPNLGYTTTTSASDITTYAADTLYTLTVGLAHSGPQSTFQMGIALLADGSVFASTQVVSTDLIDSAFADYTVVVDTAANPGLVGKALKIQLLQDSTYDFGREGFFDNVRLDATPVPEPTSLSLLGLAGLLALRRRR